MNTTPHLSDVWKWHFLFIDITTSRRLCQLPDNQRADKVAEPEPHPLSVNSHTHFMEDTQLSKLHSAGKIKMLRLKYDKVFSR